jgi:hypothetical protein
MSTYMFDLHEPRVKRIFALILCIHVALYQHKDEFDLKIKVED